MDIYLIKNQEQVGPFSQSDLLEQLTTGTISGDVPVWWEGLAEWTPLQSTTLGAALLAGLAQKTVPPEPPQPSPYQPSTADAAYLPKPASQASTPSQPSSASQTGSAPQPNSAYQPASVSQPSQNYQPVLPSAEPVRPVQPAANYAVTSDQALSVNTPTLKPLNALARSSLVAPFILFAFGLGVGMLIKATGLVVLGLLNILVPVGNIIAAILGVIALFQVSGAHATTRGFYTAIWGIILNIGFLVLMVVSIIALIIIGQQVTHTFQEEQQQLQNAQLQH